MPGTRDVGALQSGTGPDVGALQSAGSTAQTVDPAAATSRRVVGTPYIVVPGIGPGFAISRRFVGTPIIHTGSIAPAFAPTRRALGTPIIAGPIHPAFAVSRRFVGTPFLNTIQTVNPAFAVSRRFVGTPGVFHVQSIAPGFAVSRRSPGSVTMIGGPNALRIFTAPSRRAVGIVAINGGSTLLQVYVGGAIWGGTIGGDGDGVLNQGATDTAAPVTYASGGPPTIQSQTLGRWVATVDLIDDTGNFAPALGQTLVITEGGYLRFAGCIQTVAYELLMGTAKTIIFHVTATDKTAICDRRLIPVITYPAGSDVAQTILSIVSNCLNGEGITTNGQSVPLDGSLGSLTSDLTFNYDTVTDGFNQIGTISGTIWYIDPTGLLFFNPFDSLPAAPFQFTETSNDYRGMLITYTNIDKATEIYAVSNLTVLPGSGSGGGGGAGSGSGTNTETTVMTVGNIGVLTLQDGTTIIGIATSLPIGTLYSITVNGFAQTVVEITQWAGQEPNFGTNDFGPWFWTSNTNNVTLSVVSGAAFPIAGSTLVITYTPFTQNTQATVGQALIPVSPATGDPLGTCGSGRYQLAIQVQNVSSVASLNAISAAELNKREGTPLRITVQTDKQGLAPGMLLNVHRPNMFLNNQKFLITSLIGTALSGVLEFGSRFRWQVEGQSNEDPGNWFQWYGNLIGQSANPLPVPNYEDADFVLAPGSSLAGGNVTTNPYLVKNTGKLLVMYAAAGTPPLNQTLNIFFFVNGQRIPGQVSIPGGSFANTAFAFEMPITNPLYVFNTATENDVITIGVSYNVTGANPTPASNVSATLRWTM